MSLFAAGVNKFERFHKNNANVREIALNTLFTSILSPLGAMLDVIV